MGLGGGRQRRLEPPFSTRRCASSSVFGWVGRVFWREKPSRRGLRGRLCGGRRLSKRSSIRRQRSGSVQRLTPSVSGSGPRKMRADGSASSASVGAGGRPGVGRSWSPSIPSALQRPVRRADRPLDSRLLRLTAQRLPVHPRRPRRGRPAHALRRARDRQPPPRRQRPKRRRTQVVPDLQRSSTPASRSFPDRQPRIGRNQKPSQSQAFRAPVLPCH